MISGVLQCSAKRFDRSSPHCGLAANLAIQLFGLFRLRHWLLFRVQVFAPHESPGYIDPGMRDGKPLHPNFFDDGLSEPKCSPVFTKRTETFTSIHRNILTGPENRRGSSLSRCFISRKPKPLSPRPPTPPAAIVPASCQGPAGHDRSNEPPATSIRLRLSMVPIEVSIGMNSVPCGFHSHKSPPTKRKRLVRAKTFGGRKNGRRRTGAEGAIIYLLSPQTLNFMHSVLRYQFHYGV